MGIKGVDGKLHDRCLERIKHGEPFFVLRGQDTTAPELVEQWANEAAKRLGDDNPKIVEARHTAYLMRKWAGKYNGRLPD